MSREDHLEASPDRVRVGVLTISDTRTEESDTSGQFLLSELRAQGHEVSGYSIVKDDALAIRAALNALMRSSQVILSSGGTGITGRDVTVPVIESLLTKPMPGFGELFRMLSFSQVKGAAMLSRAVGGLASQTLIFAMPGSLNAVQTAWEGLLRDELTHLVFEMTRHAQPLLPSGGGLHAFTEPSGAEDRPKVVPPVV